MRDCFISLKEIKARHENSSDFLVFCDRLGIKPQRIGVELSYSMFIYERWRGTVDRNAVIRAEMAEECRDRKKEAEPKTAIKEKDPTVDTINLPLVVQEISRSDTSVRFFIYSYAELHVQGTIRDEDAKQLYCSPVQFELIQQAVAEYNKQRAEYERNKCKYLNS